jgi:hypothetical protein
MPRNDTLYLVDAKEARNTFLYAPATKQNGNAFLYTCYGTNGPVAMSDPDALAYATAGGVLTTPERLALNTLVSNLKSNGLWAKMHAIYPMAPNNATLADSYKLNLKNVALHELTIPGTITCTTQGLRNSSGSFSQCTSTTLNWAVVAPENLSIGIYYKDYGVPAFNQTDASLSGAVTVAVQTRAPGAPGALVGEAGYNIDTPNTPTTSLAGLSASPGLHVVTRFAGVTSYFVNVTAIATSPTGALQTATSGGQFGLGSAATAPISFAFVAERLTQPELSTLQNIVDTYQSALSRRFTGIAGPIDSQNFIQVAQLTRWRHAEIVNDLIIGLYVDNLWSLIQVLYPFIGGTAWSHSVNAKNPLQHQITWSGTLAHTAQGVSATQGGDGWGDTGAVPTTNEAYVGLYVNQNVGPYPGRDWGSFNVSDATFQSVLTQWVSGESYGDLGPAVAAPNGRLTYTPAAPTGYKAVSRVGTDQALYEGPTIQASGVRTATAVATATFKLFRGRPAGELSPGRTYALAVAGLGLTPTQHANLFNRIQTYQEALGRDV